MQSNTTGYSMETIFDILFVCLLSMSIWINFVLSKKFHDLDDKFEFFQRKFVTTLDIHGEDFDRLEKALKAVSDDVKADNHRSLQALLERQDAAKPIKPNNWDSIKEAFKGPVRVEINERD
jgi:hypothetical protein